MSTQLFPLSLLCFPLVVTHRGPAHCFTGIHTQSEVLIIFAWTPFGNCGVFDFINKSLNLLNPFSFRRRRRRAFLHTGTWGSCICAKGQKLRSVQKGYTLWMLGERCRCLQSSSYSQRTRYSCINGFHEARAWFIARLMDYFPSFLSRAVYILTLMSAQPNRSCWIGYHPVPQSVGVFRFSWSFWRILGAFF